MLLNSFFFLSKDLPFGYSIGNMPTGVSSNSVILPGGFVTCTFFDLHRKSGHNKLVTLFLNELIWLSSAITSVGLSVIRRFDIVRQHYDVMTAYNNGYFRYSIAHASFLRCDVIRLNSAKNSMEVVQSPIGWC